MSEIKRAIIKECGGSLAIISGLDAANMQIGYFVVSDKDHLAALKQARIDAVREFAEWCEDAYMLEDVTVVIAAKKYIEQLKEQGK